MNLTPSQAKALGRRAEQPVKAPGELLAIFCPGRLSNPLNGTPWVWQKRTRYAKAWKERVGMALLEARYDMYLRYDYAVIPKAVHFHAYTHNAMDGDGLQAAMKPIRDALVICGVISGDAPIDGHEFTYTQQINRAHRGVTIRVRVLPQ